MSETTSTGGQVVAPELAGARMRLTSRPQILPEQLLNSFAVWLGLMAYWALADILHAAFPSGGRQVPPDGWPTHLVVTLVGLAAIWYMHHAGFPAAWDARIPARRRLLLPLLAGVIFGLLAIAMELYTGDGWMDKEGLGLAQLPEALLSLGVVTVFALFFRVAVMWLYNGSGGSLLLVGLFHSAFNVVNSPALTPSLIADPTAAALLPLAAVAVAAAVLALATRGRLVHRPGRPADTSAQRPA